MSSSELKPRKRQRLLSLPTISHNIPKSPSINNQILPNIGNTSSDILSISNDDLCLIHKFKHDHDIPFSRDFIEKSLRNSERSSIEKKKKVSIVEDKSPGFDEIEIKPEWLKSKLVLKVLYLMYSGLSNPLNDVPLHIYDEEEEETRNTQLAELRNALERMRQDVKDGCHVESLSGTVTPKERLLNNRPDLIKRCVVPQKLLNTETIKSPPVPNSKDPQSSAVPKTPPPSPKIERVPIKYQMTPLEKNLLAPISF